ncbi:MAG TPA: hypothetical protein VL361_14485 [Candidatus Limnocylindrales bacterium]|nr:hypothetical protein [Candidatus Limnocylindrales bacterium]
MRTFRIICGLALLGVAFGAGLCCIRSAQALNLMLVQGSPVVCPYRDTHFNLPGRPVALFMIGIPILASIGGCWFLLRAFWKDDEHNA